MKHMRQLLALLLMLVLLSGCGAGKDAAQTTEPMQTEEPIQTTAPVETTVPTEPAVTQPQETEPTVTEVTLSDGERYEINIFLSNFSEQQFREPGGYPNSEGGQFRSADADVYEILFFTWNNLNYNTYDSETVMIDGGYYTGIALETVSARSERFFGRSLTAADVEAAGGDFRMKDGLVCRPEAWGDTYSDLSVVDAMYDLGDGTMQVDFTVYESTTKADRDGVTSAGGTNSKDIYYYTPEMAVESGYFVPHRTGSAVVRPKTLENGRETFELVTYELFGTV